VTRRKTRSGSDLTFTAWSDVDDKVVRIFVGTGDGDAQELELTIHENGLSFKFYDEGNCSAQAFYDYQELFNICADAGDSGEDV